MELVRLSRTGEEPWGFRLIGGADFNMPLTVVKVLPDSPADLADLRNGDTVASISGSGAASLTHDDAKAAVAAAVDHLELGISRGLYDPVLDDFDPIYEPIDQDDFDQPSQPTEVFQIKQFTESLDNPDLSDPHLRSRTVSRGDLRSLSECPDRSLTESPFVLSTKPYRPFSTEPTPVPPLEEPIILNPDYHDDFGKLDGVLNEFGDVIEENRFKLPISEQYDPDGTKVKKSKEVKTTVEGKTSEVRVTSKEERTSEVKATSKEEIIMKQLEQKKEMQFIEKMKKEVDLDKIEMTATSIVDESIEKAMTVADEIKKEIDFEMSTITSEVKSASTVKESKSLAKTDKKESVKEVKELISAIDKTTDVILKESDISVSKEVAKIESVDKRESILSDQKASSKQEIEETIESGSVRRKSEKFNKNVEIADVRSQKKSVEESKIEQKDVNVKMEVKDSREMKSTHEFTESEFRGEKVCKTSESTDQSDESKTKGAKYTTAKLLAEQRAYTIGLQTIPHIRGTVQSSYHYDLLLKTFFIHLTDVMVALSRFILAEPLLSQPLEKKQEVKETVIKDRREVAEVDSVTARKAEKTVVDEKKVEKIERQEQIIHERKDMKIVDLSQPLETKQEVKETVIKDRREVAEVDSVTARKAEKTVVDEKKVEKIERQEQIIHEQKDAKIVDNVSKEHHVVEVAKRDYKDLRNTETIENQITEKRMLSGAEMAQLTEKRSEELIHKMDGVITEFQTKAGLEEEIMIQRDRRSRSRSRVEEEVMKESDSKLSKIDKETQETSEVRTSSSVLESAEMVQTSAHERTETKKETKHESKKAKSNEGKTMYIAIVESHVYTNKDSILDEIAEISETSSVQSVEESNIAFEANQAMVTEQVVVDSEIKQEKAAVIESQEMASAKIEEIKVEEKIFDKSEEIKVEAKKEVLEKVQVEVVESVQPIVELLEDIVEKTNVSIDVRNHIDIQEIQSSEYVGELSVINEESVQTVQVHDVEEIKNAAQDIKISKEIIQVEEVSIANEEFKEVEDREVVHKSGKKVSIKEGVESFAEAKEVIQDVRVAQQLEATAKATDTKIKVKDECAQLKLSKEEVTEISENVEMNQEIKVNLKQSVTENKYQSFICESSVENSEFVQESSFIARSIEDRKNLTLDLDTKASIIKSASDISVKSTIDTPTPSTVPPTPLTDEYVFRLQIPLPKITGPPIPRSPSPEDEDPHIVKKNLVPHIDTEIIEEVVYDTPLPTPPEDKVSPPVYTKPGLKGGNMRYMIKKKKNSEEIQEIERKSSLLASAIDQTIKSIEEYKEEVGIDTKPDKPIVYNGYARVIESRVFNIDKDQVNVEQQVIKNTDSIKKIVESRESVQNTEAPVSSVNKTAKLRLEDKTDITMENKMGDAEEISLEGYRPVPFNPDDAPHLERVEITIPGATPTTDPGKAFVAEDGEIIGTHQGIVDGLEEAVVDEELAKEQGKPGMTEEKIAELISGESEMLREAHVMGLSRVLKSHMHRDDDDSSVDFKKIKPIVESLKDSEVLKALNEEFMRTQEEKKKEERKWTKFLQKPSRPVPRLKFGSHGYIAEDEEVLSPYKVKIVKQPKPKVAPDYKPQDFNTGPLPWEERALNEPPPPPVAAEDPILVPEETPEFLEAIDNLPESEVPDLEDTGILLPPEKPIEEPKPEDPVEVLEEVAEDAEELDSEAVVEETNNEVIEMEQSRVAEQLVKHVEGMVDPNAPLEQQLAQMRAQLAALAQLPGVIQQTLELVTRQLSQLAHDSQQSITQSQTQAMETTEAMEESNENSENETVIEEVIEEREETAATLAEEVVQNGVETVEEEKQEKMVKVNAQEMEKMKREEEEILGEQRRIEKQKKELMAELQLDQESRQLKQRPTPRVGRPKPVFGPLTPAERPMVLPGGRKWRKPKDAYNDQFIAETLTAQAEIIQGKAMGKTYESVHLPYDERVNFMKYEKPPVSLDHLQHSDVYKLIHDMEQQPPRQVDLRTPVICEADYREKCRSMTPCAQRIG